MNRVFRLISIIASICSFSVSPVYAMDWYVGAENSPGDSSGTTVDNPWKGIGAIQWGANGVSAGDTLYVVGTVYSSGAFLTIKETGTESQPITISGKAPDPNNPGSFLPQATIIGNHASYTYNVSTWTAFYGTAGAGDRVFKLTTTGTNEISRPQILEEDTSTSARTLARMKQVIFTGTTPGVLFANWLPGTVGVSNESPIKKVLYYKPTDPDFPQNFKISTQSSEIFEIINKNYINIEDLTVIALGARAIKLLNADYIQIKRCDISGTNDSALIHSYGNSNNGVIEDNKLHDAAAGIWLYTGRSLANAANNNFWKISENEIYNINQYGSFGGPDPHGIGIQGGNNILIENNRIHHIQRSGITYYIFTENKEGGTTFVGQDNKHNTIRYNEVHDIYDLRDPCLLDSSTCTTQRGIELGGDFTSPQPGTMEDNITHHNLVYNIGKIAFRYKTGISSTGPTWRLENNVVSNASGTGLFFRRGLGVHNNIFINSGQLHVHAIENINSSNDVSNNIYFPDSNATGGSAFRLVNADYNFNDWKINSGLDTKSVTDDPQFATPVAPASFDFHLTVNSPAINAGANVNILKDYDNNPSIGTTDIGAYEFQGEQLLGYWQLDEKAGSAVMQDTSGNKRNAVIGGAPGSVNGIIGSGLDFTGQLDGLQVPHDTGLELTDAVTLATWVRAKSEYNATTALQWRTAIAGKDGVFSLMVRESGGEIAMMVAGNNGTNVRCSSTQITDTHWHHVAGVYDGAAQTVRVYIDGEEVKLCTAASYNVPASLALSLSDFVVGQPVSPNPGGPNLNPYADQLDDIRLYGAVLNGNWIKQLYQSGLQPAVGGVGLVGHWRFEENPGNAFFSDSSGNNRTGFASGSIPAATSGAIENGLDFSNTIDGIVVHNDGGFNLTQELTLMTWVRAESNFDSATALTPRTAMVGKDGAYNLLVRESGGEISMAVRGNDGTDVRCSSTAINDTNWHHIAGSYDGIARTIRITIDGIEQAVCTEASHSVPTSLAVSLSDLYMGIPVEPNPGGPSLDPYPNLLDDVRLYDYAMDEAEVNAIYQSSIGPLGQWEFEDDLSDGATDDGSGNGRTGTVLGNPIVVTGASGNGLELDGGNAGIDVAADSGLDLVNAVSISAWVRAKSVFNSTTALTWRTAIAGKDGAYNLLVRESGGEISMAVGGSDGIPIRCIGASINDTLWHHVAGVYDGAARTVRVYIDGIEKQACNEVSHSIPASLVTNNSNFLIGQPLTMNPGGPALDPYTDQLDDVRIYSRALTLPEISNIAGGLQ